MVEAAPSYKNTDRGHNNASSIELIFNLVPRSMTICKPILKGTMEESVATVRREQLTATLCARTREMPKDAVGPEVDFRRDNEGWVEPGLVVNLIHHGLEISHGGFIKTFGFHRIRPAPSVQRRPRIEDAEFCDTTSPLTQGAAGDYVDEYPGTNTSEGRFHAEASRRHQRNESEILALDNEDVLRSTSSERATRNRYSQYLGTPVIDSTLERIEGYESEQIDHAKSKLAVQEGKEDHNRELESWKNKEAVMSVPARELPPLQFEYHWLACCLSPES